MALIYITKGLVTKVDDDLYEQLNQHPWYASGREHRPARRVAEHGRKLTFIYHEVMGVFAWELGMCGLVVDHKDGDPLNNERANLRIVTQRQNMANSITALRGRGVGYDKLHNRWKAYLPGSPRVNLGTFATEAEAMLAVAKAKATML